MNSGSGTAGAGFWPPVVFHALEAVKEDEKGRSTVVERTQYITRQKFFWIFCNLSLTFSNFRRDGGPDGISSFHFRRKYVIVYSVLHLFPSTRIQEVMSYE